MISKLFETTKNFTNSAEYIRVFNDLGYSGIKLVKISDRSAIFRGNLNKVDYFLKVRTFPNSNINEWEFNLLKALYPKLDVIFQKVDQISVLSVKALMPAENLNFQEIDSELSRISDTLSILTGLNIHGAERIMSEARLASEFFSRNGTFSIQEFNFLNTCTELIQESLKTLDRCIAHGDLSPENVYFYEEGIAILDWEDAVEFTYGYDQIYWLTFLANEKDLNLENLNRLEMDTDLAIAYASIIMLLKEYIHRKDSRKIHPATRLRNFWDKININLD